jgi:hypothetical protein
MTPFSLKGGRVGDGGEHRALSVEGAGGGALLKPLSKRRRAHPNPDLSPFEGERRRSARDALKS